MRAGLRFGMVAAAIALMLAPAPGLAQVAAPATNTPATDTIGPRELRDFTLNGTVTRPAETAPSRIAPAPARPQPRTTTTTTPPTVDPPVRPRIEPRPSVTATLPPASPLPEAATPASTDGLVAPPTFEPAPISPNEPAVSPISGYVPWLLALIVLAGGAAFLAWRRRAQPGYATVGAEPEFLERAQPAAEPRPLPRVPPPQSAPLQAEPRQAAPAASGVVSTRLRPWLEIDFSPGRCVVEEQGATIQFDVELYNSGSAPARDVLVEASMFNAGPDQDAQIGAFFARPVAQGDRVATIAPLSRIAMRSAVSLSIEQMREYEVGGRRLFVPLVGFNALYSWSGGDGQTSTSYLVGRDTDAEKLAPLRLDLGPRTFRGLGARQHNVGVRR
ncbi:MAG: hypothetical protein ABIN68_01045 [Sphingomicrobium sp.]